MRRFFFIIIVFFTVPVAYSQTTGTVRKMQKVPAGIYYPFFSGNNEKVNSFLMDETAVTNAEYLEFVKANPAWRKSQVKRIYADANYLRYWESDLEIGKNNRALLNSPVVYVSWFAAKAYCAWKNKKLPSVAQWEYAASAKPVNLKTGLTEYILAWNAQPNPKMLPNVKSTYKNIYSIYDMHGLIWEWTSDFNSYTGVIDSKGNGQEEFNNFCGAGGANVKNKKDYASFLRYSYRGSLKGNYCIANLGFRCIKNL